MKDVDVWGKYSKQYLPEVENVLTKMTSSLTGEVKNMPVEIWSWVCSTYFNIM